MTDVTVRTNTDEQKIADAEAIGLYDNRLFKEVRADACRYRVATEMAMAALKTIQHLAFDNTSRMIALRMRVAMERELEEGAYRE